MGVYIKGMKMPKACLACPCFDEKDYVCKAIIKMLKKESIYHCRPDWCPLVEVPPHGRLIDADALMNEFKILQSGREIFGMELDSSFLSSGQELSTEWYCVEDAIEDAPTVIEAEEVKES